MAYRFKTTKERSALMRQIKSDNTAPEILLQKALRKEKIKFKKNCREISGNPDIVLRDKRIIVFVDGEFWHGYNWKNKKRKIRANRTYWIPKIERNIARDKRNIKELGKGGWKVIRLWEHQIKKDLPKCLKKIKKVIALK